MKQYLAIAASFAALSLVTHSTLANVIFLDASLPEVRQMASREGKPYFVHFTATWCMPCQWMEKNTYADPALSHYANANYFPVKIDIDNEEGRRYKSQYSITVLPSILVFDERGILLDRYEESLEAADLLDILKKHQRQGLAGAQRMSQTSDREVLDSPKAQLSLRRPALIPEENMSAGTQPVFTSTSTATPKPVPARQAIPDTQTPRANKGYGVQVGVFSDYSNAVQQVARLEKKFDQPVNIFSNSSAGKTTYTIMVGMFGTSEKAAEYLRYLNRNDIKGIVKQIADM